MKRGLYALVFVLSSSFGYGTSVFLQESWIEQRGREQFRDTLIWKERNLEGRSGTNQYVEFSTPVSTKDRKEDSTWKGYSFLMGTNSNLEKNPNLYVGTSFGYFRGRERENFDNVKDKTRTYGANAELAYIKNKRLALLGIGASEMRHTRKETSRYREKEAHIFGEIGKMYIRNEKNYFYPFFASSIQKIEGEKIIPGSELGFRYTGYWTERLSGKFQVGYRREWMERKREKRYQNQWDFLVGLSYRYYEDLEIQLQYRGKMYQKAYQNFISLGFSHNF
ncbi:MAG TPA: hypothetical protein VIG61_05885 [Fusobacterium sp.]|uniref:hypothetical protein n=1 Tax=Fusobacterium sp. TaxID=68766 RepID=UPI002F410D44